MQSSPLGFGRSSGDVLLELMGHAQVRARMKHLEAIDDQVVLLADRNNWDAILSPSAGTAARCPASNPRKPMTTEFSYAIQ